MFLSTILSTTYEFSWRLLFLDRVGPQENHSAPFSWSQILGYDLGEKERKKEEDNERVKDERELKTKRRERKERRKRKERGILPTILHSSNLFLFLFKTTLQFGGILKIEEC